jgi:hypothetical protein
MESRIEKYRQMAAHANLRAAKTSVHLSKLRTTGLKSLTK